MHESEVDRLGLIFASIAAYVNNIANRDATIVTSAGFDTNKTLKAAS
jgi:hypothetical protein